MTFVRYVRGKRKSRMGWVIFIGLIAANELRGVYVLIEGLKALGWIA